MKLGRCPVCKGSIDVQMLTEDAAGKEFMRELVRLSTIEGAALASYLSLFRSGKRDLSFTKAITLFRELDDLAAGDWLRLAVAMQSTVDTITNKSNVKPFVNHNYLIKVLADVPADVRSRVVIDTTPKPIAQSKSKSAIAALQELKNG